MSWSIFGRRLRPFLVVRDAVSKKNFLKHSYQGGGVCVDKTRHRRGVAAGASAATKARREDELAEIILVEKGPYVSYANCGLPYYVSGEIGDRGKLLVTTPQVFEKRFNVKVLLRNEAVGINLHQRTLEVRDLEKSQTIELPYDALILAPGAAPIVPPFPGRDASNFSSFATCPMRMVFTSFFLFESQRGRLLWAEGSSDLSVPKPSLVAGSK